MSLGLKENLPDVRVRDPSNYSSQERCANSRDRRGRKSQLVMSLGFKENRPDVRVRDPSNYSSRERCANSRDRRFSGYLLSFYQLLCIINSCCTWLFATYHAGYGQYAFALFKGADVGSQAACLVGLFINIEVS